MKMDGDKIKVELYRNYFKQCTGQSDTEFDRIVASFPNSTDALAYLKGRFGER